MSFIKWFISFLWVLGVALFRTGCYALVILAIFTVIVQAVKRIIPATATTTEKIFLSPKAKEVVNDYSAYYIFFIWQDKFCEKNGAKLHNLDVLRKKYEKQIRNLEDEAKNIRDNNGHSIFKTVIDSEAFRNVSHDKGVEGFTLLRKIVIAEKLSKTNPQEAVRIYGNLSDNRILEKYGSLATKKEVCQYLNKNLPKAIKDKDSLFSKLIVELLDKYSFNLVLDNN